MLGQDEETFLSVSDVVNKNGEKYIINMRLPYDFTYTSFPDDVVKATISEKEVRGKNKVYNSYSVLVGEISTIADLDDNDESIALSKMIENEEEIELDDPICFFRDEDDYCVVFAKIEEGDIVVKDIEELENKLNNISSEFKKIQNSIKKIKRYVYKR